MEEQFFNSHISRTNKHNPMKFGIQRELAFHLLVLNFQNDWGSWKVYMCVCKLICVLFVGQRLSQNLGMQKVGDLSGKCAESAEKCRKCRKIPKVPKSAEYTGKCRNCRKYRKVSKLPKKTKSAENAEKCRKCRKITKVSKSAEIAEKCQISVFNVDCNRQNSLFYCLVWYAQVGGERVRVNNWDVL